MLLERAAVHDALLRLRLQDLDTSFSGNGVVNGAGVDALEDDANEVVR